ncbi:MAG TPA: hypothetical protein VFA75_13065 [Nevskia sp.]|jgi:hypothetical protein|nr:hypothetical protein [Nevskia sp.]
MALDSIGFGDLLRLWIGGLLLAVVLLGQARKFGRPRPVLILALLPALSWLPASLPQLVQRCQAVLLATPPGLFIERTFNLPLS